MRNRALIIMACLAVALSTVGWSPAAASIEQPTLVSTNPANFTPNVNQGKVFAVAQVGDTIVLGGTFSSVTKNGTTFTRNRILAFDANTGAVSTTFVPTLDNTVEALADAGDGWSVYVGGRFNTVNGSTHRKVVRLNVNTGAVVNSFSPGRVNGKVKDLKLVGDEVFISGGFTKVDGQNRRKMASLDRITGDLTTTLTPTFEGVNNGGSTNVPKFDVSPDGTRLVAIGNFATVDGLPRHQIVMMDLSGPTHVVTDWSTDRFPNEGARVFNTYMRDLDFSPDGSYFIISTTGAYRGPDSLCDTITRWETDRSGPGQEPTWIDHTGGDTTYAVAATGTAVYAGGHMRWVNNPYAGDAPGAGAVPHEGIVALDPSNGLPFSWDGRRARGVGVFDFLATDEGLWVASDTNWFQGERRQRIAFLPLAGGQAVPAATTPELPGDVVQLGRAGASADPSVLYRVNAGGSALLSVDDGPDWQADSAGTSPYRNSGSNSATWTSSVSLHGSFPSAADDGAPAALYLSERWDPGNGPEMEWNFPVTAGTPLTVRLYLGNQCTCTDNVGERVFDVSLDGTEVLSDVDMVAAHGHRVGYVESFDVTADADGVDIDFAHQVENPLVNAIEIIDRSAVGGGGAGASDEVQSTPMTAAGVPGSTTTTPGNDAYHFARGAFVVGNTLYTPWADGTLKARSMNGTSLGAPRTVELFGGTFTGDAANVTGAFFDPDTSRLYYTLFGDGRLFWRWFTPESEVVGAVRFEASAGALPAASLRGMFLSGGELFYAEGATGDLYRIPFDAGTTGAFGPGVNGSPSLVDSGRDWSAPGLTVGS